MGFAGLFKVSDKKIVYNFHHITFTVLRKRPCFSFAFIKANYAFKSKCCTAGAKRTDRQIEVLPVGKIINWSLLHFLI